MQGDFKPFSFLDAHQQRVGFEVDLIRELARRWLGNADAVTFVPVPTERRIATLLEGKVDLIAAALTNTPARQQQIAFSRNFGELGDCAASVEECVNRGVLRIHEDGLAFPHELSRLAVESTVSVTRAQELHGHFALVAIGIDLVDIGLRQAMEGSEHQLRLEGE